MGKRTKSAGDQIIFPALYIAYIYQITFIVTSPQHKCLGERNTYERAPNKTIYIWTLHILTDCTEDNVQNTHTYTQYT